MCGKGHYAAVWDQFRPIPSELQFQYWCAALGEASLKKKEEFNFSLLPVNSSPGLEHQYNVTNTTCLSIDISASPPLFQ